MYSNMYSRVRRGMAGAQSAGPLRFLIVCSMSIFLLASLVAGRRPQCTVAGNVLYHTYPLKSHAASPGRSHVGPALYVFSLWGKRDAHLPPHPTLTQPHMVLYICKHFTKFVRRRLVNTTLEIIFSNSLRTAQIYCTVTCLAG